jgi:predicted alpha/beta superfamily hydrolase
MKRFYHISSGLFLGLILLLPVGVLAQSNVEDVILGKSITLKSDILGEDRQIMVYLPTGYERVNMNYPVLYLLDGRTHFQHASSTVQFLSRNGRIPQMIVVAIVNVDRTRDFTPTHMDNRPQSGGVKKFISFMQNELFAFIEKEYRTVPYRLLEGHSLGGMFSIHVLFKYPKMFQAHFAMSPYIMWDSNYNLFQASKKLENPMEFKNFLYITIGNEPNYIEPLKEFTTLLETKKPKGLEWHYTMMDGDNHGTVPLKSLYNGLELLYENWALKAVVADQGIDAVHDHYNVLSAKYGYKVDIPENVFNAMGYRAINQKKIKLALEYFLHNVTLYPNSANVYDSLGEGYEAAGNLESAKKNYQIAVERGTISGNNNLVVYKEHLDNVTKKLQNNES